MPSESSAQTAAPSWRAIGLSDGMNLPRHSGLATEILRISNEIDGPPFAPGETSGGGSRLVHAEWSRLVRMDYRVQPEQRAAIPAMPAPA